MVTKALPEGNLVQHTHRSLGASVEKTRKPIKNKICKTFKIMNEQQLRQRLDDIDEKLNKIEKILEKGYVENLLQYVQALMTELKQIKSRL